MKFTVVWLKAVEDDLAKIYLDSADGAAVTNASDSVDALLATRPLEVGVPHPTLAGLRVIDEPPLRVVYRVDEADRKVLVGYIESLW